MRLGHYIITAAVLLAAQAHAGNFATCILDKAPGTANDVAAQAIAQLCLSQNPGGIHAVQQGAGRGWFGFNSGAECTIKKAAETQSNRAAQFIGMACRKLYDECGNSEIDNFLCGR